MHDDRGHPKVLAGVRAGTLDYPEPLAVTRTDEAGAFSLPSAGADTFVVAYHGVRCAVATELDEEGLKLQLESGDPEVHVNRTRATVTLVNPFTREVRRLSGDSHGWVAGVQINACGLWAGAELAGWPPAVGTVGAASQFLLLTEPRTLAVRLVADGGPVEGTVRLQCETRDWVSTTDGGVAFFPEVTGELCSIRSRAADRSSTGEDFVTMKGPVVETTVPMKACAWLSVRVFDRHTAAPIAGVYVSAWPANVVVRTAFTSTLYAEDTTNDAGVAILEQLPLVPLSISAEAEAWQLAERHVTLGAGPARMELPMTPDN